MAKYYIKDFSNKRNFFRLFYLYGAYSNDQIPAVTGKEKRSCEEEISRYKYFIDKENISVNKFGRKTIHHTKWDRYLNQENILFRFYKSWSCSPIDLNLYFMIMTVLTQEDYKSVTDHIVPDIYHYFSVDIEKTSVIYKKISELIDYGLVEVKEKGNLKKSFKKTNENRFRSDADREIMRMFAEKSHISMYRLTDDILDNNFSQEELYLLYHALDFFRNSTPVTAPAYFIQEAIVTSASKVAVADDYADNQGVFLFFDMHPSDILNDDFITFAEEAAESRCKIRITYKKSSDTIDSDPHTFENKENSKSVVIPLKIVYDSMHGRHCFFCFDETENRIKSYNVNEIYEYDFADEIFNPEEYEGYKSLSDDYFTASGVSLKAENKLIPVVLDIFTGPDRNDSGRIISRIKCEGGKGKITRLDEYHHVYETEVIRPLEMIPWIRSFGSAVKVRRSSEHDLYERIKEDWEMALKKYDDI